MAVYVELRRKAFDRKAKELANKARSSSFSPVGIRRPTYGIEIKDDTFCYLRIVKEDGEEIPLPRPEGYTGPYANFIISDWARHDTEKMQIVETFGEDYLYFFGRSPTAYSFGGYLLNTNDFPWVSNWYYNYGRYLRGSRLAEMKARAYLYLEESVISGYFTSVEISISAANPHLVHFSTMMLVTDFVDTRATYVPFGLREEYITGLPDPESGIYGDDELDDTIKKLLGPEDNPKAEQTMYEAVTSPISTVRSQED